MLLPRLIGGDCSKILLEQAVLVFFWSRLFWYLIGADCSALWLELVFFEENCSGPGLDQQYSLLLEVTVLLSDWRRLFCYLIGGDCSGIWLEQAVLVSDWSLSRLICSLIWADCCARWFEKTVVLSDLSRLFRSLIGADRYSFLLEEIVLLSDLSTLQVLLSDLHRLFRSFCSLIWADCSALLLFYRMKLLSYLVCDSSDLWLEQKIGGQPIGGSLVPLPNRFNTLITLPTSHSSPFSRSILGNPTHSYLIILNNPNIL